MTSTISSAKKHTGIGTVFLWQARQGLGLTIAYIGIFMAVCLISPHYMPSHEFFIQSFCAVAFALVLPAFHFGDCFKRAQADLCHAMPVSRNDWFWGRLLASLVSLWLPLIPGMTLRTLIAHDNWHNLPGDLMMLGIFATATLLLFTLCAVASGTYFEYGILAVLLTVCPTAICWQTILLILRTVPYETSSWINRTEVYHVFTPPLHVIMVGFNQSGLGWPMVATALLLLPMAGASWYLYHRRASEDSGISRRCKPMELFLRTLLGLTACITAGHLLTALVFDYTAGDAGIPLTLGSMALALVLTWLAAEFCWKSSLKGLARHWGTLAVSTGLAVLMVAAISTGLGLDTPPPDPADIAFADLSLPIEQGAYFSHGMARTVSGRAEEELWIQTGVSSEGAIEKVRLLHQKLQELERASQYPYLPGRRAYEPPMLLSLHYWLKDEGSAYTNYHYNTPRNAQADSLMAECRALQRELLGSEEYVDSLFPVFAIDTVCRVYKRTLEDYEENGAPMSPQDYYATDDPEETYEEKSLPLTELPAGFEGRLEKALREDFAACRYPSYRGAVTDPENTVYMLFYKPNQPFTAKGGILHEWLYDGTGGERTTSADGKELVLAAPSSDCMSFAVSQEMTSTWTLLEKEYPAG